jgi:hypothetical protein
MFVHLYEYLIWRILLRPIFYLLAALVVLLVVLTATVVILHAVGQLLSYALLFAGALLAFRYTLKRNPR